MLAPMHLPPIGALADVYPVLERRGGAGPLAHEPLAAILSRTRSPSSQRARAKVDEGPFASLNATRRKLTPGTRLAISALHLPAGQLHIMGRDQGGKPGRPDDRVERLENMDGVFRIEIAGRLVGAQYPWAVGDRAGDRDPLLLVAGQFGRPVVSAPGPAAVMQECA